MVLRREVIQTDKCRIPITLSSEGEREELIYAIDVDGVEWLTTDNQMHAVVLFTMMFEHLTEYMHYESRN